MKHIKYNGKVIANIICGSVSIEEALYTIGYDINVPEDLKKAYEDGFEASYIDDEGNAQIDIDALVVEY